MMKPISELKDLSKHSLEYKRVGKYSICYSGTIYTFDLEATSLFKINNKWQGFDKNIKNYSGIERRACVYHCQFSIEDEVYYFYNISQFQEVLHKISHPLMRKIIWVHNLSYETGFLEPILNKYTITDMIALENRQPIRFVIEELNIEFRCSYKLTQLPLSKSAEQYTTVKKAVGDLDYNILRSPLSAQHMTEEEKNYCEMDCICLYHIIKWFKNEYKALSNIPFTQTGRIRYDLKKYTDNDYYKHIREMVPSLSEYDDLKAAFQGGITHANRLHVKEVIQSNDKSKEIITSIDISSSYPFVLCTEKFPKERFKLINKKNIDNYSRNEYCHLYKVTFKKISSIKQNIYISSSKCSILKNPGIDNGRVFYADLLTTTVTDIDLDMIKKCYKYDKMTINKVRVAKKDYLPLWLINYILDGYCNKTTLKGVKDQKDIYNNMKERINCIYGCFVTDNIKSSIVYDNGWICAKLSPDIKNAKLDEQKSKYAKNIFAYSPGVWCTAYARRNLFERIIDANPNNSKLCTRNLDYDVVYYDTDSLKMFNFKDYKKYFEEYNRLCDNKIDTICKHYTDLDKNKFYPKDKDGVLRPLGYYDFNDGHYSEFCTLGAKRYCYRDIEDGKLHITVSGVNKKEGVKALKDDIINFNDTLFFNYDTSGKRTKSYYNDNETYTFTDNMGNEYTDTWSSGVVIYPTTYSMSLNFDFAWLIEKANRRILEREDFIEIRNSLQERKIKR